MLERFRSFLKRRFANASKLQRSSKVLLGCSTALATVALVAFSLSLPKAVSTINVLHSLQEVVGISESVQGGAATGSGVADDAISPSASLNGGDLEDGSSVEGATEIPRVDTSLLNNVALGGSSGANPVSGSDAPGSKDESTQSPNKQDKKSTSSSSKKGAGKSTSKSSGATSNNSSKGKNGSSSASSANSSGSSSAKYKPNGENVWLTESEMKEYVAMQQSLSSAYNDASNELGILHSVCGQSPMHECQSWKSSSSVSDYSSSAKNEISKADKAIAKANSFLSRSKPSSKYQTLSDTDTKLRTVWKNVISGANLIKSFYNKYLQCPNPKTHSQCFGSIVKSHLTSYEGIQTVDYLANASKTIYSIKYI